jgi:hypothetical protein
VAQPPVFLADLKSAYGDTVCANQEVEQPTSTAEVAAAVKKYYDMSSGTPVKIRVVTRARDFSASDGYRYSGKLGYTVGASCTGWISLYVTAAVRQA